MNHEQPSDRLEALIKQKDLADLTTEERSLVLRELGDLKVYDRYRQIARQSQEALAADLPPAPPGLLHRIQASPQAMRPDHGKGPWLTRPIPAYQAAAALALAILLTGWWSSSPTPQPVLEVLVTQVDTVYQTVVQIDTVFQDRVQYRAPAPKGAQLNTPAQAKPPVPASSGEPMAEVRIQVPHFPVAGSARAGRSLDPATALPGSDSLFSRAIVADGVL